MSAEERAEERRNSAYYRLSAERSLLPPVCPVGISERDWAITLASYRDRRTQVAIAREMGLSAPRVRQILMRCAEVILDAQ